MSDYGIKISRAGFPVTTASDTQLLWSSSFKMPFYVASGTFNLINLGTTPQTIFTHNLGYVPYYFCYSRSSSSLSLVTHLDDAQSGKIGILYMDSTHLYYNGGFSGVSSVPIAYYIFGMQLGTTYTAPNLNTTDASGGSYSQDYGFKVSNDGKSVTSAGLVDLASFSGASLASQPVRHQIIHKTGSTTVNNTNTVTIAHGLSYAPMFLTYVSDTPGYFITAVDYTVSAGPTVTENYRSWADGTNINIRNNTGNNLTVAYLIFKDPII